MGILVQKINELKAGEVGELVARRTQEFRERSQQSNEEWFSELCFCILTANSTARSGIKIQHELGSEGFLKLPETELKEKLRRLGHRFPNTRAHYIVESRKFRGVKGVIEKFKDERHAREWLVNNVKGLGWKEASHFLRNVGFVNVAILDRHVLSVLHEHELIDKMPRSLTRARYLEIEKELEKLARRLSLTLGELDLYLWYLKTGEVLK